MLHKNLGSWLANARSSILFDAIAFFLNMLMKVEYTSRSFTNFLGNAIAGRKGSWDFLVSGAQGPQGFGGGAFSRCECYDRIPLTLLYVSLLAFTTFLLMLGSARMEWTDPCEPWTARSQRRRTAISRRPSSDAIRGRRPENQRWSITRIRGP